MIHVNKENMEPKTVDPVIAKIVAKAKTRLILDQSFYASILLKLGCFPDWKIPTFATDGKVIKYNPDFISGANLTVENVAWILIHEVLHVLNFHPLRKPIRGGLDERTLHRVWNMACDHAINPLIDYGSQPEGALDDRRFHGMAAEGIFRILERELPDDPGGGDQGGEPGDGDPSDNGSTDQSQNGNGDQYGDAPNYGDVEDQKSDDGNKLTEGEKQEAEQEIKITVEQAATLEKNCGSGTSIGDRFVTEQRQSKTDWKERLLEKVSQFVPSDFTWSPPNRRFIGHDILIPGYMKTGTGNIVIGIDVSFSVNQSELNTFAGNVSAIVETAEPETITVIYCHSKVCKVDHYDRGEEITFEIPESGGTSFSPVFREIDRLVDSGEIETPLVAIYFTDLCSNDFGPEPDCPVIWGCTSVMREVPFGEVVLIDMEEN